MPRRFKQEDTNVDREFQEVDSRLLSTQDSVVPIGGMVLWTGDKIPDNFLECNGQSVAVQNFPALFKVLQRKEGAPSPVDGEKNFKLPDLTMGIYNFIIRAK